MNLRELFEEMHRRTGELTPRRVVDEAVDPEHPLHHRFTWDNTEAADKWRLHQAAALIRSVNVVVERQPDSPPIYVRAFVAKAEIKGTDDEEDPGTGQYLPVTDVVASDVMRTAWFQSLRRDWERLKRKAGASQEFAQMVLLDLRDMAG